MKNYFDVKDLVVFITGASKGIGREFALRLAEAGAKIVVTARSHDKLVEVVDEIKALGGEAIAIELDVTSKQHIDCAIAKAVSAFGCIDVLINNAAIMISKASFWDYQEEEWDQLMDANLKSVWMMSMAVAKHMKEKAIAGSIINISSTVGVYTRPNNELYSTSKAAVNQLTRLLALDLVGHNIRVNAIAPSLIATDMGSALMQTKVGELVQSRVPMKRLAEYEELMGPLFLLASKASSFMTGVIVPVDGGLSCNQM